MHDFGNMAQMFIVSEDTDIPLDVVDNVEELYNQKNGFWDRNGGIHGMIVSNIYL